MNLQPLEDRIVVRPAEAEETTISGLVIPDTAKEKPQQGEVLAVGPGRRAEHSGELIPLDLAVGDTVVYSKYGGTEITVDGEDLLILSSRDVLAKTAGGKKKKSALFAQVSMTVGGFRAAHIFATPGDCAQRPDRRAALLRVTDYLCRHASVPSCRRATRLHRCVRPTCARTKPDRRSGARSTSPSRRHDAMLNRELTWAKPRFARRGKDSPSRSAIRTSNPAFAAIEVALLLITPDQRSHVLGWFQLPRSPPVLRERRDKHQLLTGRYGATQPDSGRSRRQCGPVGVRSWNLTAESSDFGAFA